MNVATTPPPAAGDAGAGVALPPRRRPRFAGLRRCAPLALLGYLVLGVALQFRLWVDPQHLTAQNGDGDPGLFIWFLGNTERALASGHGLLLTTRLNAPAGVNTMWNTSLLLPGAVLSPLTALAGPLVTYNVLLTVAPALTAWSAHLAARRFVQSAVARATVGLVAGSLTSIASLTSHLHLSLLFLAPPILLVAADALTGRRTPVRAGLLLGALAACQLLIGEEVLTLVAGTVALLAALLAVQFPRRVADRARDLLVTGALAAAVVVLVDGWPLWSQFAGAQRQHGALLTPDTYKLDPAEILISGPQLVLHPQGPATLLASDAQPTSELIGHLGLPLALVCLLVAVLRRRDAAVRTVALTLAALVVLACGSTLILAGHRTGVPLPSFAVSHLPVLNALLPIRWMLMAALLAAVLAGLAVDRLRTMRGGAVLAGAACLAVVLPTMPLPQAAGPTGVPAFFSEGAPGVTGTALLIPLADPPASRPMTWQAIAGMRFSAPRGYFVGPGPTGHAQFGAPGRPTSIRIQGLTDGGTNDVVTPTDRQRATTDFAFWQVSTVLLAPSQHRSANLRFLTSLLGARPQLIGDVYVWRHAAVAPVPPVPPVVQLTASRTLHPAAGSTRRPKH